MKAQADYCVYIGRFQPCTPAHLEICIQALEQAKQLILIVGSAQAALGIRNPFTTEERIAIIEAGLKEKGIRDDYIVLVGGAPLNEEFAEAIGADAYCRDAAVAVETAQDLIKRKHNQLPAA